MTRSEWTSLPAICPERPWAFSCSTSLSCPWHQARHRYRYLGLACAGAADQDDVVGLVEEVAARKHVVTNSDDIDGSTKATILNEAARGPAKSYAERGRRYVHFSLDDLSSAFPQRLETAGVFRLTRNPIYTLFLLPIVALSVYSVMAAILAAIAYVAAMNKGVIVPEERALAEHFGLEYKNYASRTPRWLFRRAA